jgi:aspartyl/glutamyl-tRNA(Asn/Gln) amidotransferase B subunit
MEEDSGKSIHDFGVDTLVDLNRAGVPLIEIVSEPDMRSSDEGYAYLMMIKSIVTYLGICDGNMEEGSLRCDANVSVRLRGAEKFGQKTEVKNLNSFRNVKLAIEAEIERQIGIVESGEKVLHQSMLFDANKGVTRPMRTKEEAHDYRYFPEPDLLPVTITKEYLEEVRNEIPELRFERRNRLMIEFGLSKDEADFITESKDKADYFEATSNISTIEVIEAAKVASELVAEVMEATKAARELNAAVIEATKPAREQIAAVMEATKPAREQIAAVMEATKPAREQIAAFMEVAKPASEHVAEAMKAAKVASEHVAHAMKSVTDIIKNNQNLYDSWSKQIHFNTNFMKGELQRSTSDWAFASLNFAPQFLASLSGLVTSGMISNTVAKEVFQDSLESKKSPELIVEEKGLAQISDQSLLREKVREVLASNPDNIAKYKSGKTNLFGFFVGQTMKAMGGKANPTLLNEVVKEELEKV